MEQNPAPGFEYPFHPVVQAWFEKTLGQPTSTQREGWPPISKGKNVLVCAPTGTGKTLTAFLYSLNDLLVQSLEGRLTEGTQVLYITPLKALGNDIAVNLQRPLEGIRAFCAEMGYAAPPIRVGIRHGDVPPNERQAMLRHPPHLLITTPESFYLLLTGSHSAKMLSTVRTVIVDELHALLDTKRGAHLTLSLERLSELCAEPPQRIGLSATIALPQAGASFLCG
ncbi:MAG TPA: DEAD/DEAH box helicase, partial [Clostridia bacterium]|nr:DEAD/DEAH box helicase [Clostridia bacterium]